MKLFRKPEVLILKEDHLAKDYLDNFRIIYEIDPFSRINLSNQLEFINSIQDNDKKIKDIRKHVVAK